MKLVKVIDKVERVLITIMFAGMLLAVFAQVMNRNLFKLGISWFEEVARGCMIYMLMLATEISLREHSQINVDSAVRRLPAKAQAVVGHISTIAVIVFCGTIGFASLRLLRSLIESGGVMPALQIPRYWFQACVTVGCLLAFLTQVIVFVNTIIIRFQKKKGGEDA